MMNEKNTGVAVLTLPELTKLIEDRVRALSDYDDALIEMKRQSMEIKALEKDVEMLENSLAKYKDDPGDALTPAEWVREMLKDHEEGDDFPLEVQDVLDAFSTWDLSNALIDRPGVTFHSAEEGSNLSVTSPGPVTILMIKR